MASPKMKMLAYLGLFTALIALSTAFIKIPTAIGYANLGDGFILGAAVVFGPYAFIPAALGSMLADLYLGYAIYAPATLVIKGLMGLCAGLLQPRQAGAKLRPVQFVGFLLAEAIMVLGYFVFEFLTLGAAAALGSLLPNLGQAVVGLALGSALIPVIKKVRMQGLHLGK